VLLAFAYAPLFRVLDTAAEAPFRQASVEIAEVTLELAWWGTAVTVLLSVLLARLWPAGGRRVLSTLGRALARPGPRAFALAAGALALTLAFAAWALLYDGLYTNVDEIASAIHARALAGGRLGLPLPAPAEFWLIPNTLVVAEGWVSQYPPTHLLFMALFHVLGAPGLVGPALFGGGVWLLALALPRLLPDTPPLPVRAAVLLSAASPFLVFLAGGALSHLTAGAAATAALYAALRARDGRAWWAAAAGLAVGVMVAARPLVGLILGTVLTAGVWAGMLAAGRLRAWSARVGWLLVGGAPMAVLLGWFNARLFGGPTTFGYLAAFGQDHALGFHRDPWGYRYGPAEALGFTSTDLLAAGVQFLETALPLTAAVAVLLLVARRLPRGAGVLLAWALLPVAGNALYWFHASRMLYEAAPAWIALAVLGVAAAARAGDDSGPLRRALAAGVPWAVVISLVGALALGVPTRARSYTWSDETRARITPPAPPGETPALVFVHTSWNERLSARLQGAGGMRQDSVISALRRNTNCALDRFARFREGLGPPAADVDLVQDEGTPPGIVRRTLVPGSTVRTRAGEVVDDVCLRELRADRFGVVALAPLVWQGDLPGDERGRPLFVRDFGPERNRALLETYPGREPWVFVPKGPERTPELVPYDEAMAVLWGG